MEIRCLEKFDGIIAPKFLSHSLMQLLSKCFSQPICQCLHHYHTVVIKFGLESVEMKQDIISHCIALL